MLKLFRGLLEGENAGIVDLIGDDRGDEGKEKFFVSGCGCGCLGKGGGGVYGCCRLGGGGR